MMKSFMMILSVFILASCQKNIQGADVIQEQEFKAVVAYQDASSSNQNFYPQDPVDASAFETNISLVDFDFSQEAKVLKAVEILKKVVRSSEFKDKVINFTYKGKKQFVDNNGLTNMEIYQKLLEGSEELAPAIDYEMDLELELYYSRRSTVGYTYPDELKVWINTKFFNVYDSAQVAGNIFHEWTHKLGFEHAYRYSTKRNASVPYALGYLVEELGKKYL